MSSTESADEEIKDTISPPKKRLKRGHFDVKTKEMIWNVYENEMNENPTMLLGDIDTRVGHRTGVCSRSVRNIIKEYKISGTFSAPRPIENRKSTFDTICDMDKNAIRRTVHEFFFKNKIPTTDKVLRAVNEDPDLPNFKRTTFYKILKKLNFKFSRHKNSFLMERGDIVCWRRNFLKEIRRYRNENRKIFYLDENLINVGHKKSKLWIDQTGKSSRQTFLHGLSTGLKNAGKEKRLVICYIGSEDGFLPDSLWAFESSKSQEMDSPSFERWFAKILPALEENSVVVMDNAPHHCRKLEEIPTAASRKEDIQEWLRAKNITFDDTMIKAQLLRIVNENKKKYNKYIVDEMAKEHNNIVLRLPPYHCELNPLEPIWAEVKESIVNTIFEFADMTNIFNEVISNITPDKWKKCVQYVQHQVEPKMWEVDNIIESIEPLLKRRDSDDSSSDSDDSD